MGGAPDKVGPAHVAVQSSQNTGMKYRCRVASFPVVVVVTPEGSPPALENEQLEGGARLVVGVIAMLTPGSC